MSKPSRVSFCKRTLGEFFTQQTACKPAKTRSRSYSDATATKFVRRQGSDSLSTGVTIRVFYRLQQSAFTKLQSVPHFVQSIAASGTSIPWPQEKHYWTPALNERKQSDAWI